MADARKSSWAYDLQPCLQNSSTNKLRAMCCLEAVIILVFHALHERPQLQTFALGKKTCCISGHRQVSNRSHTQFYRQLYTWLHSHHYCAGQSSQAPPDFELFLFRGCTSALLLSLCQPVTTFENKLLHFCCSSVWWVVLLCWTQEYL